MTMTTNDNILLSNNIIIYRFNNRLLPFCSLISFDRNIIAAAVVATNGIASFVDRSIRVNTQHTKHLNYNVVRFDDCIIGMMASKRFGSIYTLWSRCQYRFALIFFSLLFSTPQNWMAVTLCAVKNNMTNCFFFSCSLFSVNAVLWNTSKIKVSYRFHIT